ncbi:hypothetical protein [Pantoea sp. C8B4]|uniref:hypothetical protein n=1 Tax=Pantoea sp. C8B4 TaxID=3243083 RepID=UPI003F517DF0
MRPSFDIKSLDELRHKTRELLPARCDDLTHSAFQLLLRGRNEWHRSSFSRAAMILSVQHFGFFSGDAMNRTAVASFSRTAMILSVQHSALHQSAQ